MPNDLLPRIAKHLSWMYKTHTSIAKQCQQMDEDSNIKEWERLSWTEQESKGNNSPVWSLKIHKKKHGEKKKRYIENNTGNILKLLKTVPLNYFFPLFYLVRKISTLLKICAYKALASRNMPLKRKHHVEILFTQATKAVL